MNRFSVFFFTLSLLFSCTQKTKNYLPILGQKIVENGDTLYHTIPDFRFVDQDSNVVTRDTFQGKIYVADFFFTSCTTICPVMKTQMLKLYKSTENLQEVKLLSHTIDPEYDTVALLHDYADRLGVSSGRWHFVTGDKKEIYDVAKQGYFATVLEDSSSTDGFVHSGAFLLIDKQQRIRGKYDGTEEDEVNQLIEDINTLRREYE